MRARLLIALVAGLSLAVAGSASAQEAPKKPRRGGLHVSGGGVVGYVGGSGSISGNVTGPGGGGGSSGVQPVVDSEPTAIDGGVVSDTAIPTVDAEKASARKDAPSARPLGTWVLAVLIVGGVIWLYRRGPVAS